MSLAAAACTASSSKSSNSGGGSSGGGGGANTASARGVTADTINVGFSFPDLAALAKTGLIKADNGDYALMAKVLTDDINASGGINGRKLKTFIEPFSVLQQSAQLAVCSKLTEDDKVFAVLGGFPGNANLCITQQHSTILISGYGSGYNQGVVSKAKAPWATWLASDERAVKALVKVLDQQGRLKNKTIGVYGEPGEAKPLVDLTVAELKNAGYTVKDTAINDAPTTDSQAENGQDKIIASRFQNEGITTVFVLGTVPPGTNFDSAGFHPEFYSPQTELILPGAFTNPYGKFPLVAGLAPSADPNAGYDTPTMKHCRDVYTKATGKTIEPFTQEQKEGKSSGFSAMSMTCAGFAMFEAAAKAAGANLTPESWQHGLESQGHMALPVVDNASFAPGKLDGQDDFQLEKFNPVWTSGSSVQQFLPLGQPITLSG
jgi:hypothetical protein